MRPVDVWRWYERRSPWTKWFWLFFVVLAIGAVAAIRWFSADDDEESLEAEVERQYQEVMKDTEERSAEIDEVLVKEAEQRNQARKKLVEELQKARGIHGKIDNADSFDDVDDAVKRIHRHNPNRSGH